MQLESICNLTMKVFEVTRKKYHKKDTDNVVCPFCNKRIINKQNCARFSFEYWYVLVNKHPYMNGNVMLVSKKHHDNLDTLSMEEWQEFTQALIDVKGVLGKMFKTESFSVGINIGKDSGGSVAHIHWQIIPRKKKIIL